MPISWRITYIFFLYLICCLIPVSNAQLAEAKLQFQVQKFGVDDGLSSRISHCFFQDSRGFMWVGTDYGLNRFDGLNFKVYTKEQDGLSHNQIVKVFELEDGKLWLSSANHLLYQAGNIIDVFDPIEEKNVTLLDWVENPELLDGEQVYDLFLGDHQEVFLPTVSGKVYKCHAKKLTLFAQLPPIIQLTYLQADHTGGLWAGDNTQLIHVQPQGEWKVVIPQKEGENIDLIATSSPNYINYELGPNNRGQSSMDREVRQYDKNGADSLLFRIDQQYLRLFIDVKNKEVGVIHNQTRTFGLLSFQDDPNGMFKGSDFPIHAISVTFLSFWDAQGGIWIDNPPNGIARLQPATSLFRNFLKDRSGRYHSTTATRGIMIDAARNLYITSRQELNQFHTDSLSTKAFSKHSFKVLYKEHVLLSLLSDYNGSWLGASRGVLLFENTWNNELKKYTYSSDIDPTRNFALDRLQHWSMLKDREQRLWLGHQHGLSYLGEDEQLHLYKNLNGFNEVEQSQINHLYENDQGIWIVSSTGLYLLDTERGILARFHEEGIGEYRLPHTQFHHLYEDKEGHFWLASAGGGLIKWHPKTKKTEQFTIKDGLSHNVVYATYEDDYNNLWLSSNRGIMRFEKERYFVTTYLPIDGITHEEFNRISHYQDKDGTIYFGGLNGVTSFHPKDFQTLEMDSSTALLQFIKFSIQNGKSGNWEDETSQLIRTHKIELQPSDLGFSLEFAHLDFSNFKKKQFAYLIEGFDQNWNYQQANLIRVNQLPYGDFKLRIKAQEKNGIWGQEQVVDIEVVKPVYLRVWFLILVILLGIVSIFLLIKWRLYRSEQHRKELQEEVRKRTIKIEEDKEVILHQTKELTKLDKLKSRFFANISHELRTPLTLILGPAKHIQTTHENLETSILESFQMIEANGESLLQLVEEILELAKLEANQIQVNERPIQLRSLLARLYANFESQASYLDIQYELINWPNETLILLDVNKISKVINNLIANALKFTPKGATIQIKAIQHDHQTLRVSVTDTGKGIHPEDLPHLFERFYQSKQVNGIEQGGTGIGLALSKELAEVMKGQLDVESILDKGSTFTLILPYKPVEAGTISEGFNNKLPEVNGQLTPINKLPILKDNSKSNLSHLLLVEDNPSMQQFIVSLLQDEYEVTTANHGKEAIAYLEKEDLKIDLIISDVMMPEMDGFTLLERVKRHDKWRQIPVIMLTARAAEADRLQALQIGVDDYLTKPFSTPELQARIRNLLHNYQERLFWKETVGNEQVNTANVLEKKEEEEPVHSENDREWLKKLEEIIVKNIGHNHLTMDDIADNMHLSQRQMGRKLKQLTGLTPLKYQREIQLQKARVLLEKGTYATVLEVVHRTGFKTHHHFTQLYVERYGKKPNEYFK